MVRSQFYYCSLLILSQHRNNDACRIIQKLGKCIRMHFVLFVKQFREYVITGTRSKGRSDRHRSEKCGKHKLVRDATEENVQDACVLAGIETTLVCRLRHSMG